VKPTRLTNLLAIAIAGVALAYAAELVAVRMGYPILVPPVTLAGATALLAVVIPSLAWPVRQRTHGNVRSATLDPFYATRVLLISQAGSVTGSAVCGGVTGVVVFLLTRPVIVWPSVWLTLASLGGAVLMVAGSLIAESWCVVPPADEGESSSVPEGDPA
jgi:hypothetical protein